MYLFEIIRVAFGALLAGKVRALLTMLGIIIGTAAVITVMAMGAGAEKAVQDRIASMADADLTIYAGAAMPGGGIMFGSGKGFTIQQVQELRESCPFIAGTSISSWNQDQPVKHRSQIAMAPLVYNVPEYQALYRLHLARGRFYTEADNRSHRRVAVLGSMVAQTLGNGANMLGRTIRAASTDFTVIGVLEPRGMVGFTNVDNQVIMPVSTNPNPWSTLIFSFQIKLADGVDEEKAAEAIERAMRRIWHLPFDRPPGFVVRPAYLETTQLQQETANTFSQLLLSVAAVSLVVGGIGVMNIMLVSVTERTREIGIRKALGARRRTILLQFVLEAIVLCLFGGAIGAGGGIAAVTLLSENFGWQTIIAPESIVLALGFSVAVGLFFGTYPAFRAARLDPVDALRHE